MSAHLAACASGSGLFLFIYLLEELSQTLFLWLGQKRRNPSATHQLFGGGLSRKQNTKNKSVFLGGTPAGFTRPSHAKS